MDFFYNPLEYILNRFGLTMQKKPTLLGQHISDFTNSSWLQDQYNQNRFDEYLIKH